ncbi:MAG: DEAD/DEAH box helicase [Acidobacteriota bacterium]|nr:DEAD/DEAH box helicase [Blastocatellia bacterium]MDW8412166.1 DEAD/DEAH box helicase [Acidobacteriota bacterium]
MPKRDKTERRGSTTELERFLEGVGVPKSSEFVPDDFQLLAVELVTEHDLDVLVSAPTGSGKTWIAIEAMKRILQAGNKAWYTTPLKALSNDKFREFSSLFGGENVGILTGERKVNPAANLIVATTEIYRNALYDAMNTLEPLNIRLVVLDEVHYLADRGRGVVWEEAIIYSPATTRMLMLSATVGNAQELADWVSWARGSKCRLVIHTKRPVPMRSGFITPEGALVPLFKKGTLHPEVLRICEESRQKRSDDRGRY